MVIKQKGCASPLSAVERSLCGGLSEAAQGSSQPEELLWALNHILGEMLKTGSLCPKIKLFSDKMREGVRMSCFLGQFLKANAIILI